MSFTVVAFCYSWTEDLKTDAYQSALLNSITRAGGDVHVILANYLVATDATHGIRKTVCQDSIIAYINQLNPAFILSMNNGGLSRKIQEGIRCPILSWIVDDFAHIFYPEGARKFEEIFTKKAHIILSSMELFDLAAKKAPKMNGRIHFLSSATDARATLESKLKKDFNICFIGSFLDSKHLIRFLAKNIDSKTIFKKLAKCVQSLHTDYHLDFYDLIERLDLKEDLSKSFLSEAQLKMYLSNIISNHERIEALDKLKDLGFALFGNDDWTTAISFTTGVLNCFQAGVKIREHHQLIDAYNRSKISINIPQIQVGAALPYRVFDILASDSLLITKYFPESDAFKIFGKDCPIPMYRDLDHLKELCKYYLDNENERLKIVKQCNALVARGFSFDDRIRDLAHIIGFNLPLTAKTGKIIHLKPNHFDRQLFRTYCRVVGLSKWALIRILRYFAPKKLRLKMINLLVSAEER